jgi:hypothetical protein
MVNGKPGDDPILVVTVYGLPVFTEEIDRVIREVWPACGTRERDELRSMLPVHRNVGGAELEELQIRLEEFRSRLLGEARERGWEGPPGPE